MPRCVRLERHMCHPVKLVAPKGFLLCRCWWGAWLVSFFSFLLFFLLCFSSSLCYSHLFLFFMNNFMIFKTIYPNSPPTVLRKISSTSKAPTFKTSWAVSISMLKTIVSNVTLTKLFTIFSLDILGNKKPNGIKNATFPARFIIVICHPYVCFIRQNLFISLNRTRLYLYSSLTMVLSKLSEKNMAYKVTTRYRINNIFPNIRIFLSDFLNSTLPPI